MGDSSVLLGLIALTGTIATGFFALINKQIATYEKVAKSMDAVADSNRDIAKETRRGNQEAKDRNGHLAELVIQNAEKTITTLQKVDTQHVETQVVHNETVKHQEVK